MSDEGLRQWVSNRTGTVSLYTDIGESLSVEGRCRAKAAEAAEAWAGVV
jgi:hypothetical protein